VDGWPVGVAIVGHPVSSRLRAQGWLEVTRVATNGTRNACSALYGAAVRAYPRVVTYTRADEPGTSLRAAGWVPVAMSRPDRRSGSLWRIRWAPRRHFVGPEIRVGSGPER
jgi:hypothetical protein